MAASQDITLESIYEEIMRLQKDVDQIKKSLLAEPELRDEFILRMKDIDLESSIPVDDFQERYGL